MDWQSLSALTALRSLSLQSCYLHAVPPVLARLTGLHDLDFDGNGLAMNRSGGWNHLTGLTQLTRLCLISSGARKLPPALAQLVASLPGLKVLRGARRANL